MWRRVPRPPTLYDLPEDVLLEIAGHLDAEDIFTLRLINRRFKSFTSSRDLWLQLSQNLCNRLPLAIPPRRHSSIATHEIQSIIKRALRLENNWRSESPAPRKPPRLFNLTSEENYILLLRLLPGGRLFLLLTADGRLKCHETHYGSGVGEWKHGGYKIHSIDVGVVDDGSAMLLAASVDRLKVQPQPQEKPVSTHTVHVLRINISEDLETGLPTVEFVHIMASPGEGPWWIVSLEGDIIAAYACDIMTKPLTKSVVWVANWKTKSAAVVHLPESVIRLQKLPTLQVAGNQIWIFEDRSCCPASVVFPVPDISSPRDLKSTLAHVKITPTLIQNGDRDDNTLQTRFSKIWRNDRSRSIGRPLSLFSISMSFNPHVKSTVRMQTFDPLLNHKSQMGPISMHSPMIWRHRAFIPSVRGRTPYVFCLGRYGSFPVWIEEVRPQPDVAASTDEVPELNLMGLFTEQKSGGSQHVKRMAPPAGVQLHRLERLDLDDAEGILCGVTRTGVWLIEY